jgi:dihydrofolate synthase/folylpolyglutamate synthase
VKAVHDSLIYEFLGEQITTDLPNLVGKHQIYNVGAALTAYRIIMDQAYDAKILSPASAIPPHVNPLKNIFWPGRLQKLEGHPLNHLVSDDTEIWIDGGHNDSAGYFLAQQAKVWQEEDSKPLDIILAMVDRKKPEDFISPFIPYAHSITVTEIQGEDSTYKSRDLYDVLAPLNIENLFIADTVEQACHNLSQQSGHRILITGSLYLLGTILN